MQALLAYVSPKCKGVRVAEGQHERGLYAVTAAKKGDVLLTVPKAVSLVVDFDNGISLPSDGAWPRLQAGANHPDALPWDLLLALALLDALSGDGGQLWARYADGALPEPQALTLPMCWSPEHMQQLQHGDIIAGAAAQQARLAAMFPDFAEPMCDDGPTFMQWALACVRSRAFKVGNDAFAFVPFLDIANHAEQPTADFRVGASGDYELYAVKDVPAGQELTISYTGAAGYTNQRLMAQYGFVPSGGNAADRLALAAAAASAAASGSQPNSSPSGQPGGGGTLSLERFQCVIGDRFFLDLMGGKNPYLYAALKSFPLRDEHVPGAAPPAPAADGSVPERSAEDMPLSPAERALAEELRRQVAEEQAGYPTSLKDDAAALELAEGIASRGEGGDAREIAALRYRLERKRLLNAADTLLKLYCR